MENGGITSGKRLLQRHQGHEQKQEAAGRQAKTKSARNTLKSSKSNKEIEE